MMLIVLFLLASLVLGLVSTACIYLSQKNQTFAILSNRPFILIFFLISLISQVILRGPLILYEQIGQILGAIIVIFVIGIIGVFYFKILNKFLFNKKYLSDIKSTVLSSFFFPIIVQFLSSMRAAGIF